MKKLSGVLVAIAATFLWFMPFVSVDLPARSGAFASVSSESTPHGRCSALPCRASGDWRAAQAAIAPA